LEKHQFIQVINTRRGTIRSLCKVYYSSLEDQKDAFQDIVLQLWKSIENFEGNSKINTWIYRVSLNTILSKKRKDNRSINAEPIAQHHQHLQAAKADDNLELLYMVIHTLKDIDKAIVILYLEGYQNREIAQMLSLSPTNVSTRFNRLKSVLKMKFDKKEHATERS